MLTNRYILQRVVRERLGLGTATRYGDIYVMAEQAPNPNPASRVLLSDKSRDQFGYPVAQVDWRMSVDEWDHFGAYFSLVAKGLGADERVASLRLDSTEEWPQVRLSSSSRRRAREPRVPKHGRWRFPSAASTRRPREAFE